MTEKAFQNYFMNKVHHGYRTSLVQGGGFPDCLLIKGERHTFVELKVLNFGVTGNRSLRGLFKQSQPPWYYKYLSFGGERLFIVLKMGRKLGLLKVTKKFLAQLPLATYQDLIDFPHTFNYQEFKKLPELLWELEK